MKALRLFALMGGLALVIGSLLAASWQGLVAAVIGAVGTACYLGATWLLVKLIGDATKREPFSPRAALFATLAVLLKLPLIYLGWKLSAGLGPFGPTCFLLGLGLVYCGLIWRAALAARADV